MLTINLLGKTKIAHDEKDIESLLSTKTIALICLLLIKIDKQLSREKIIGYLWPDSAEEAARYNLRYNLWLIKKAIPAAASGEHFILSEKDCCSINSNYPFFCDLTTLQGYQATMTESIVELLQIKKLFRGDVLEGWYLKNCNEFNDTILFERMVCENKQMEVMNRLAALYQRDGSYVEALQVLKEMATIEPENEALALNIMQTYVDAGNRGGAINYYKAFEATLWSSLGISPEEQLKQQYHDLLSHREPTPAEVPVAKGTATAPVTGEVGSAKKEIRLETDCLKAIPYFWMAQVVEQILKTIPRDYLMELPQVYWQDLSYIQREVELCLPESISSQVPAVRVVQALYQLLQHVAIKHQIVILIANPSQIDDISSCAAAYIKAHGPKSLSLREIN